jgi:hypothetical protein
MKRSLGANSTRGAFRRKIADPPTLAAVRGEFCEGRSVPRSCNGLDAIFPYDGRSGSIPTPASKNPLVMHR